VGEPVARPSHDHTKGVQVRPTTSHAAGRRGEACEAAGLEETLARAQRLFADVAHFLETEIERQTDAEPADEARIKSVKTLIQLNAQALLKVIEIESKLGHDISALGHRALDLEAARDEIDRRLARVAA
jgi:hypothetical protein